MYEYFMLNLYKMVKKENSKYFWTRIIFYQIFDGSNHHDDLKTSLLNSLCYIKNLKLNYDQSW